MARPQAEHIVVVGAGAPGLIAARELGRAAKRVTILEARDTYGGRIHPLPSAEFGYPAEGGAEFIHGNRGVGYANYPTNEKLVAYLKQFAEERP